MCSQYLLPCKIYCRTTCNGSRRRGWRTGTHSHEKYKHVQKVYYDIIDTYQFLPCSNQNWKLRYFGLNKKVLQFYFRFWMYSWVVNKNFFLSWISLGHIGTHQNIFLRIIPWEGMENFSGKWILMDTFFSKWGNSSGHFHRVNSSQFARTPYKAQL